MVDAFLATYATFRHVQGRKAVQFVFEVPVEKATEAFAVLGGAPNIDQSVWVGITRMDMNAVKKDQPAKTPKPKRHFHDLPVSAQAALLCKDMGFWKFIGTDRNTILNEHEAADNLRRRFGVESRAHIPPEEWALFVAGFEQWANRIPTAAR